MTQTHIQPGNRSRWAYFPLLLCLIEFKAISTVHSFRSLYKGNLRSSDETRTSGQRFSSRLTLKTRTSALVIGTRKSPLALAQVEIFRDALLRAHPGFNEEPGIIVKTFQTTGDSLTDTSLVSVGGKSLFTKELDEALIRGDVDVCIHSMKDVQIVLPTGTTIAGMLPREDPRDAFVSRKATSIRDLPNGSIIGTSSLRRRAQVLALNPFVSVINLRGNVQTRLEKLEAGKVDAILLAIAGMRRLGLEALVTEAIPEDQMLPAVAQGAIGMQCRSDDTITMNTLSALRCISTEAEVCCERAFLRELGGDCGSPFAGHAMHKDNMLSFSGFVATEDGKEFIYGRRSGPVDRAAEVGVEAAKDILVRGGRKIIAACR